MKCTDAKKQYKITQKTENGETETRVTQMWWNEILLGYYFVLSPTCTIFVGTMTIQEAQARVDAWIKQYGVRYFSELTNMAVLTEEVGEVARVIARRYGDQSSKPGDDLDLADELADVLWVLMCLANQTGIDLDEALERNFAKKTSRDSHRHLDNEKLKY